MNLEKELAALDALTLDIVEALVAERVAKAVPRKAPPFGTCKQCGSEAISPFFSTNEKYCHTCEEYYPWSLDHGQKPLLDGMKQDDAICSQQTQT